MSGIGRLLRSAVPRGLPRGPGVFLGALVTAIVVVGGWLVLNGPVGDFRTVALTGYDRADREEIETLVADAVRRGNMISIPDDEVREAARRSPWIDDVAFRRRFPSTLEVAVLPARPVAVAVPPKGGKSVLVSNRGLVLGPAGKNHKLPRIRLSEAAPDSGERLPQDSRAAWRFVRAAERTAVYGQLRGLRLADGDLVGHLREGPDLAIGAPEQLRAKALSLNAVYKSLEPERRREIRYVNVTVPDRPAIGEPASAVAELVADAGATGSTPPTDLASVEPAAPADSGAAEPAAAPVADAPQEPVAAPEPEPEPPVAPPPAPAPEAAADAISPALPGGLDDSSAPPPPGAAG